MPAPRTAEEIREVNIRYHDTAAAGYDLKWGIDFGPVGRRQVVGKLRKLLGAHLDRGLGRTLEIGAGTGYFSLNLLQAGVIEEATCTDISGGMLEVLQANARRLGLQVTTARAGAEALPFPDESFDVVIGHAVLHHLPELPRALSELHRVLRPSGRIAFAGEPSRVGDRLAILPKRAAGAAAPVWRRLMRARPAAPTANGAGASRKQDERDLEGSVDVHAFSPAELAAQARAAGFSEVVVRGEELTANWFGWFNRGLEATADPDQVPTLWRQYAFHGYLTLQRLDQRLLEPRLPAAVFYNLLLGGRRR